VEYEVGLKSLSEIDYWFKAELFITSALPSRSLGTSCIFLVHEMHPTELQGSAPTFIKSLLKTIPHPNITIIIPVKLAKEGMLIFPIEDISSNS